MDMTFGGATLAAVPFSALFLSFLFYGFLGWLWESTVCAMLNHGHFANSGFLLGPCCPIYGVGGVVCWLLLRGVEGLPQQFLAAALVCSAIEYAVGVLLERTTGARFWDYSYLPFNLNGRICLYWACVFGVGALAVCRVVQPLVFDVLRMLPAWLVIVAALALGAGLAVDAAFSLASWRRLSEQLERVRTDLADRINDSLRDASDSMLERIPESAIDSANLAHVRGRAINGWLAEIGDAALDAARERASMPAFIADGKRGLALAARRVADAVPSMPKAGAAIKDTLEDRMPRPSVAGIKDALGERMPDAAAIKDALGEHVPDTAALKDVLGEHMPKPGVAGIKDAWEERAPHPVRSVRERMREARPVPRVSLRRRDLRFFNAFPHMRITHYEGVIRATNLRDRARDLFRR